MQRQVAAAKRRLQLEGYTGLIRALSINSLSWGVERLLSDLRKELSISLEEHLEITEKVSSEPEVDALREGRVPPKMREAVVAQQVQTPEAPGSGKGPGRKRKMEAPPPPAPAMVLQPPLPPQAIAPQYNFPPAPQYGKQQKKGKKGALQTPPPEVLLPPPAATVAPPVQNRNPWIGRVVERLWEGKWHQGVVSDYHVGTGMHAVTYNINSPWESFEWYNCNRAASSEFRPTDRVVDLRLLTVGPPTARRITPDSGPYVAPPAKAVFAAPPPIVSSDRREDQPLVPPRGTKKKGSTPKAANRPPTNDKPHDPEFEAKVRVAGMEELGRMSAQLRVQEAKVLAELIEIGGTDDEEGEEAALGRLTREWDKLSRRETELRQELLTLES